MSDDKTYNQVMRLERGEFYGNQFARELELGGFHVEALWVDMILAICEEKRIKIIESEYPKVTKK